MKQGCSDLIAYRPDGYDVDDVEFCLKLADVRPDDGKDYDNIRTILAGADSVFTATGCPKPQPPPQRRKNTKSDDDEQDDAQ
jgi:hypothetical protein